MTFEYVGVEDVIARGGLRMVVVGNVPSPWSEVAKGILHIKEIAWAGVRLVYDSEPLKNWAGQLSAPVAVYKREPPRGGWAEILALAEHIAPTPALLPADPDERALVLDLSHDICGAGGLGWSRRLQLVHAGLHIAGGFPEHVAKYLGRKYGYNPEAAQSCDARVVVVLGRLGARLKAQHAAGSRYYVGNGLTAADIYSATFTALFAPLPSDQCAMDTATRAAFETRDAQTEAALDPILFAHRDMMYAHWLELPMAL